MNIDWSNSFVEIGRGCADPSIVGLETIDLIIMYAPIETHQLEENLSLRSGRVFEKYRQRFMSIPTFTGVQQYSLGRQTNIGIDANSYLVGFDLTPLKKDFQGLSYLNVLAARAGFISLQFNTMFLLDNLPILLGGYPQIDFQKTYIPITPTKIGDIDWERSQLSFPKPLTATGEQFSMSIIYADE
jgi:hypothetical protein